MGLLSFLLVDIKQQHAVLVLTFACVPVAMLMVCLSGNSNTARMGVLYLNLKDRVHGNMVFLQVNSSFSLGFSIIPLISTLMR